MLVGVVGRTVIARCHREGHCATFVIVLLVVITHFSSLVYY